MNTCFLEICSSVTDNSNDDYHCVLDLKKYSGPVKINPVFLLLEGLNQTASRAGKILINKEYPEVGRVLPVKIISFSCCENINLGAYRVNCSASQCGEMVKVFIEVFKGKDNFHQVAKAEIAVAPTGK